MKKILVVTAFIFLFACQKDFIVKDIKDKTLTVNAPANNTITPNNSITFWWELLDGAEKYNIQIVKPDFIAIQQLVADTNVRGNKLTLSLNPGTYQWRIKAVNNGGSTVYQVFNLKIDSTTDLSNQLVVLTSPASGIVSASNTFTFSWNTLYAADKYEIQVLNGVAIVIDTVTANTNYVRTISTTTTGNFSWKVKAMNNMSVSQYTTPRTFKIDLTKPGAPINLMHTNGSNPPHTYDTLKWTRSVASTDIDQDSLYIYTDAGLTSVYTSTMVAVKKIRISDLVPTLTPAAYWWRVKSVDSVGNISVFSSTASFTLIP